ncbi:hypothetical protein MMA231_04137 (plasmid) [Asticcacaulis sp. MM231]
MSERADPFSIVVDANVLAGALTRNIILSLVGGRILSALLVVSYTR